MVKSKLKTALDRMKGRDYAAEKQQKMRKKAEKEKRAKGIVVEDRKGEKRKKGKGVGHGGGDGEEEEEDDEDVPMLVDVNKTNGNAEENGEWKDEEDEADEDSDDHGKAEGDDDEDEGEDEEEYSDIDLEAIEHDSDLEVPDLIPHQRLTINNTTALTQSYKSIALPLKTMPFVEHLSLTTSEPVEIKDVDDDLNRELAFYKQALDAAKKGRAQLFKEGVPFSRPMDYFAEMVKSDEHMGKIRSKLLDEAAGKKAAQEARKLRDLKKFGKQVQNAKLQEREKTKKDTLEKIKLLKRKRQGADTEFTEEADQFDVALEEETEARGNKRGRRDGGPNSKRQKRNQKYGFGGKKRHSKSGDATSSGDLSGFSAKANKARGFGGSSGGKKKVHRPGKSARKAKR